MTASRKSFSPIDIDLDDIDRAAEELARKSNIPTLTAPATIEKGAQASASGNLGSRSLTGPSGEGESAEAWAAPPDMPQTDQSTLKFSLSRDLLDHLHLAARRERISVKCLIMRALKAQGFPVRDEDLVPDGRRLRGNRAA